MNMIEIQDAYVARLMLAHSKITARTKGHRFNRSKGAARREAVARLLRKGYTEADAAVIVKDAHDVFLLEVACQED